MAKSESGDQQSVVGGIATKWQQFRGAVAGSTMMMFAVSLPAVMGAVGVATDFAFYSMKLSQLQTAADQAAIAGAQEMSMSNATTETVSQTAKALALSISGEGGGTITPTVKADFALASVKVTMSEIWTPFFAHYLGADVTPVIASATARLVGENNVCVLTLDDAAPASLHVLAKSTLNAKNCGVYVNSTSNSSVATTVGGTIKATQVCTAGGVSNGGAITPAATTDCPAAPDPLAGRSPPPSGAMCDHIAAVYALGSVTLDPGTYCGGLTISGVAEVKLNPGVYVIKDGPLTVAGLGKIKGEHVGFYLDGNLSIINFLASATVDLSGPKSGPMAGLLVYEDRSSLPGRQHLINALNAHTMTGTIYLPQGNLLINPGGRVAQNSAYTAIVARNLKLMLGPELVMNSNYGATDVPVPEGIRASKQVVLTE